MRRGVRLSQCMIVKNEEKNIERALSWGKDIVYEQIVVDTGSTDRTVEIAERMGAKVYHFEWIDDFAAAKNYAIELAKGDWIAFLDADEYFPPEDVSKLIPILRDLQHSKYEVLLTNILHLDKDGKAAESSTYMRIFRNRPGLRYRGRIHEELASENGTIQFIDGTADLSIYHTGYLQSAEGDICKSKRNVPLIEKTLEEEPDNYVMMGYLGDGYVNLKRYDEAIVLYQKAIEYLVKEELSEYDARSAATFKNLMRVLLKIKGDVGAAEKVYQQAVRSLPKNGDFDYVMGEEYIGLGRQKDAVHHLERGIGILEKFGNTQKTDLLFANLQKAWEDLTLCYYGIGDLSQCVNCTTALLRANPWNMRMLQVLLLAFLKDEQDAQTGGKGAYQAASPAQVREFLGNLYNFQVLKDRLFVLKAAMGAGYEGLVQELRQLMAPRELESFDRAMGQEVQKQ